MKKAIIIILCVFAAVLTALATVLMIIKTGEKSVISPLSSFSEFSTVAPSSEQSSTPSVAKPVLNITSPKSQNFTTINNNITFKGNYEKNTVITINGENITTDQNGNFSITKELKYGSNKFSFMADGQTKEFNIHKRYIVISEYSPKTQQSYSAGAKFQVSIVAREGISPTASFNGKTITLTQNGAAQNGFASYIGSFNLPTGHFRDLNLGKVTFKATHNGYTESFSSANVTCKKEDIVVSYDPNATPKDSNYTNVGSGIITEIVAYQAETFDAGIKKDTSKPSNNYLPKGTVDYGSADAVSIVRDGETYKLITLRCGKTVYEAMRDKPSKNITTVVKQYVGLLPDHNEITVNSFENGTSHTKLTLDVLWKAPFYFNLNPQSYNNDYSVTNITFNYVDITFCYATVFNGDITIPQDNPIFSSAKIIKNNYDYTLRLYLKKQGGFYGWDSYYDNNGRLCFEFLNPAKVTPTDANQYGADLTGVTVLIDVGHGGIDGGAVHGRDKANREAIRNLILANKLKIELTSIGATVVLTRTTDVLSTTDNKLTLLKKLKPNYCIAIHHDSNTYSSLNGFGSYYYTPFSKKAAEFVLDNTFNTGIYKQKTFKLHKYFTSRNTVCPVVLTENGYMSNNYDYGLIINNDINNQKAKALTKGIAEYFLSIQ